MVKDDENGGDDSEAKADNQPKRPMSPFCPFVQDNLQSIKDELEMHE